MPRSVSGVYTLPNPPVVTNTTIVSTDENTTRSDMASEITNSLDRSGRGGMLAPLQLVDGTPSLPGLTFSSDVNTGMYRITADTIGFAVAGSLVFTIATTGVTIAAGLSLSSPILTATTEVRTPIVDSVSGTLILKGATVTAVTITGANVALAGNLLFNTAVAKILPGATSISHRNFADSADNLLIADSGAVTVRTTLTTITSVVTPLVGTDTATNLSLKTNGAARWIVNGTSTFGFFPSSDNVLSIGDPSLRVASVFTPIIDSGSTGSLSLKTNNGTMGVEVIHRASGVNWIRTFGGATLNPVSILAVGETNVGMQFFGKGTGSHTFFTGGTDDVGTGSIVQLQVLHTASANRNITITGSNGGNPVLNTTAGLLQITPAIVFATGVAAGTSGNGALIGGVLSVNTAAVGNVGSGEDDLMTYLLLANSLNTVSSGVKVTAWGLTTSNANAKTLKIYFGSVIQSVALTASIAGAWRIEMLVFRITSSTQGFKVIITETVNAAALAAPKITQNVDDATETLISNLTIKVTGEATTTNDIIQEGMLVEYFD